jgi:HK97 gp10 family phage protein
VFGLAALNVEVSGGKKWKKTLSDLAKMKMGVKAGVLGGATTTDGKSIAEYAIYNEFGTQYIPPRPFLSDTAKRKGKDWAHVLEATAKGDTTKPETWARALVLRGETMKAHIQQNIQQGSWIPNAQSTIRAKAAKGKVEPDHPLIDTGQMLAAISYEVVKE